jgi:hypothetical protein
MESLNVSVLERAIWDRLTKPAEMRLHNIVFFAMWTGPALLIYGWTLQYHVHWYVTPGYLESISAVI